MAKMVMKIGREVAEMCGCSVEAVAKYAQNPENQVNFIGSGKRKTYIWLEDDIERFKNRPRPGRPPRK